MRRRDNSYRSINVDILLIFYYIENARAIFGNIIVKKKSFTNRVIVKRYSITCSELLLVTRMSLENLGVSWNSVNTNIDTAKYVRQINKRYA